MNKTKKSETPTTTSAAQPKRKAYRWTQDTAQTACQMRKDGRTNAAICEHVGCVGSTLNGLFAKLKKANIHVPRAPGWRQVLDLKQLGLTFEK
jgi:hypothetical protein